MISSIIKVLLESSAIETQLMFITKRSLINLLTFLINITYQLVLIY